MNKQINILVSGGGTGGHVFPAIAIANAIRKINPEAMFLFVGANGKIEMEKVPQAGYAIKGLPIAGFQRGFSFSNLMKNLVFPFKLIYSMCKALFIVAKYQPNVAVGTGGYASAPVLKICSWLNVPTIIQEQNSLPGVTNKILSTQAAAICVAYEGMEKYFPKEKIVVTGNPIRENIYALENNKAGAKEKLGFNTTQKLVFITGGSLGARSINKGIEANLDKLQAANIQLLWQCGSAYYETNKKYHTATTKVQPFIQDMNVAFEAADMIISRAGASTISELAVVGKPVILLPSPNVAEDHQTKNVEALVEKQAAILIKDTEAEQKLGTAILEVLENETLQNTLSENIKTFAKPNAAVDIAKIVLEKANKN